MAPGDYDWTGFYVGAHVGGAWSATGGSTVNTVDGAVAADYPTPPDWHGGIQVGYDHMLPSQVVLGVEADCVAAKS